MAGIVITVFSLIVLLFSVIIHELAHGYIASSLGDPTAKYAGRLTMNPLKHLDPFGSVILPLLLLFATAGNGPILGWAKPVPVNPYNFRDQKWGSLKVAIAGPLTNFGLAIIFGILIRFLIPYGEFAAFSQLLGIVVFYNFLWGIFNLIPIPPLDGSWILFTFLPSSLDNFKISFQQYGMLILIFFIFFGGLNFLVLTSNLLYNLVTGASFL